jgi:hypothetical protein
MHFTFFNPKKFEQLTEGREEIQLRAAKAFIEFSPLMLQELRMAITGQDAQTTVQIIHTLKLSTEPFCVDSLYEDIVKFERIVPASITVKYPSMLDKLILDINSLVDELKKIFPSAR